MIDILNILLTDSFSKDLKNSSRLCKSAGFIAV